MKNTDSRSKGIVMFINPLASAGLATPSSERATGIMQHQGMATNGVSAFKDSLTI
jgi:hypothetical protein